MPESDETRFACIGCGAMNRAGAEACAGCGHRFTGPEGGRVVEPLPGMAPVLGEPRVSFPGPRPIRKPRVLAGIARGIGFVITIVATGIAFVVAFFVTCSSLGGGDTLLLWSSLAGLAAASAVVGFSLWVGSLSRPDRPRADAGRYKGEDR